MPADKFILKNASVTVNAVDLSAYCTQVQMDMPTDEVDLTGMGATNKVTGRGLNDASITVSFLQSYMAAKVDATLWPLSQTETPFNVIVKPDSAAVGVTNPTYTMSSLLFNYAPISGSLGEAATTEVVFRNASQSGIVRATS